MKVKGILDEDFVNYKLPSMTIMSNSCNWKCCVEAGVDISVCQNAAIVSAPDIDVDPYRLFHRYCGNAISKAIVFGGLEPMLQSADILEIIGVFRSGGCMDDIVIYTGYNPNELGKEIVLLKQYPNIVMKFGRYIPNGKSRYDAVLGVALSSENQFGERIS